MGNMQAAGYAEGVAEGWASLRQAIGANLRSNHFPALPLDYVEPIVDAIALAEAGREDEDVRLPSDINPTPRVAESDEEGNLTIAAHLLLDITHSWGFVGLGGAE